MVQILARSQALDTAIPITSALVGRALDLAQMRDLMEGSGGLVLGMAGLAQRRQAREVQRAVNHVAGAGQGVGQNARRAGGVHVGAVVTGVAAGGGAALGGDLGEDVGDGGAGR